MKKGAGMAAYLEIDHPAGVCVMKNESYSYPSSNGVDTIGVKIWMPQGEPVGVVQLVHGMCEYLGRYEETAQVLTQAGYVVCGEDHLGHGSSVGRYGTGYFAPREGWRCLVEDVHTLTLCIKSSTGGLPYFLLGHSMGSFLARAYGARYGEELTGLVLCGTSGPNPLTREGIAAAQLVCSLRGEFTRSALLQSLLFGSYNSHWLPARTPYDWISRDDSVVDRYAADPLCTFVFTASAFVDLLTLLDGVSRPEWAKLVPKDLPVLLISGEMDPVGNYGKGVAVVCRRLRQAGVKDVHKKLYPGCRHELFNELQPSRNQVFSDLLAWLNAHRDAKK